MNTQRGTSREQSHELHAGVQVVLGMASGSVHAPVADPTPTGEVTRSASRYVSRHSEAMSLPAWVFPAGCWQGFHSTDAPNL